MLALPPRGPYRGVRTLDDLAFYLGVTKRDLMRWGYRKSIDERYVAYTIPKRSGKLRTIHAPKHPLRTIQRQLLEFLKPLVSYSKCVHGFRVGRSIVTNARGHIGKKWIAHYDIEDFFPSITRERVARLFMTGPFWFEPKMAWYLAGLCTYDGRLPQGSPMSPLISNICMRTCDSRLTKLAKDNLVTYTRYADDLVFSSTRKDLPTFLTSTTEAPFGTEKTLAATMRECGFKVNSAKTRVLSQKNKMLVTGVVVNRKSNVSQDFIRKLRRLIYLAKRDGFAKANSHFVNVLDPRKYKRRDSGNALRNTIQGRLAHMKNVRGEHDELVLKYYSMWQEVIDPGSTTRKGKLVEQYERMTNAPTPQASGYELERLIVLMCEHEAITVTGRFRPRNEEVDGMIQLDKASYFVECKNEAGTVGLQKLDALYGKLSRRPDQVWGLYISMSGYSAGVPEAVKEYPSKRIILFGGEHIRAIVYSETTLSGLIEKSRAALAQRRIPLLPDKQLWSPEKKGRKKGK